MKVVTGEQMRKIEKVAIEELGIPSILLMEAASLRLTECCLKALESVKNPKTLIVCGPGGNGGDGMALARHLHNHGVELHVIFIGDINAVKGDPSVYLEIIKKLKVPIEPVPLTGLLPDISQKIKDADIVVDAMLGTALTRNVDQNFQYVIEMINRHAKYVISVDIPSGVHAGTGQIMGCAVEADETVTFAYPKTGILAYPGAGCAGKVHVADISLPANLADKGDIEAQMLTESEARNLLPLRRKRSNKGSYGRIVIFAGSNEMPGAAALASSAAYVVGGGLVCACAVPDAASVIHHWQREVVTRIVPEKNGRYFKKSIEAVEDEIDRASVIVAGPGIGRDPYITEFIRELIGKSQTPIILDADALFAVSEDVSILKNIKSQCVITPHPGEMSRLVSAWERKEITVSDISNNIIDTAVRFSKEFKVVTLLKDTRTIIARPDGNFYINTTGNDALSKAGTGDALTGMIAGFIAQSPLKDGGTDVFTASVLGAYIHGKSGEAASLNKSHYSVTASDLLEYIPSVINNLTVK
jgi:NAD(P)H-hydrate epimerase